MTDLPFAVVADPAKRLYAEFGAESSPRALLSPHPLGTPTARAILRGRERPPARRPQDGRLGLPVDFYGKYGLCPQSGMLLVISFRPATAGLDATMSGRRTRTCRPVGGGRHVPQLRPSGPS